MSPVIGYPLYLRLSFGRGEWRSNRKCFTWVKRFAKSPSFADARASRDAPFEPPAESAGGARATMPKRCTIDAPALIGMNTERDRLRTLLPECERKMFTDSAEKQIAAARAADEASES